MTFDYNPQIPQPKDSIAKGQDDFLSNFNQLALAFDNDHVALNAASNAGNHAVARLIQQNAPLNVEVSELGIYSKLVANQTDQLFLRYQGNGTEIQYSNYQIFPVPDILMGGVLVQHTAFSFLPGGIIIYFGFVIPQSEPFNIVLNPPIAKNIIGINLGVIGGNPGNYPGNPSLEISSTGVYEKVIVTASFKVSPPIPQCFIILGLV